MTKTARRVLPLAATLATLVPASTAAAAAPSVTTGGASGVSPNAATVSGSLNPNGRVTTWFFQYGRTKSYGNRTTALDAGSGTRRVSVSSQLTNLQGKTTYHYRLVATNSSGTTRGTDRTFKTPEAPTVSTIAASPNPVAYLRPVVVSGFLVGPRGGGGKRVQLQGQVFPYVEGFHQIGNTVLTRSDGGYQFVFSPFLNTQIRVVDQSSNPPIVSPVLIQNVHPFVTLHASRRSRRGVVRFHGFITPIGTSSVVLIQRRTHRGWTNVTHALPRRGRERKSSRFSRRARVRRGVYRAVARPSGGATVEGISRRIRVHRR